METRSIPNLYHSFTQGEVCNGAGQCVCGKCDCNESIEAESEIFFSGDFCEIASKSDQLKGIVSMCDMLTPCVKKDVFPDDPAKEVWAAECNGYPINTFYKCNSVFDDDKMIFDNEFRTTFQVKSA